jgi:hypothetical protein
MVSLNTISTGSNIIRDRIRAIHSLLIKVKLIWTSQLKVFGTTLEPAESRNKSEEEMVVAKVKPAEEVIKVPMLELVDPYLEALKVVKAPWL